MAGMVDDASIRLAKMQPELSIKCYLHTGMGGEEARDRSAATSSITLSCEPKRSRLCGGDHWSDWRVKQRFTLRVVTCPNSGAPDRAQTPFRPRQKASIISADVAS